MKITVAMGLAAFLLTASGAHAATYECADPPDVAAKLGVPNSYRVTVRQDREEGTCTFSVNGVRAGSPPQAEIFAAMDRVEGALFRVRYDVTNVEAAVVASMWPRDLAFLLSSAGELVSVEQLSAALEERVDVIYECFALAQEGAELREAEFELAGLFMQCISVPGGEELKIGNMTAFNELDLISVQIAGELGAVVLFWPFE